MNPLWTKDFKIITIGSIVSLLGNALTSFAISLLVLDYTNSTLYYGIYVLIYTIPQIIVPILSGPIIDKFSRRRTIYILDFLSSVLYFTLLILINAKVFNFLLFSISVFVIGVINGIYQVAYNSFYPMLVHKDNYAKAYAISATIGTISLTMIPISALVYNYLGMSAILCLDVVFFLTAAIFETRITDVESHISRAEKYKVSAYFRDLKDGIAYVCRDKGLLALTVYFAIVSFSSGASQIVTLPWFKENYHNGEYVYIFVWAFMAIGRLFGSIINYKKEVPKKTSLLLFFLSLIMCSVGEGVYLYTPVVIMCAICFVVGVSSAISYNIRESTIQKYIPDNRKGRFNGAFLMLSTVGLIIGEALSNIAIGFFDKRIVLTGFMLLNLILALVIYFCGGKYLSNIFLVDNKEKVADELANKAEKDRCSK